MRKAPKPEAPRDVRSRKIQVRFDRARFGGRPEPFLSREALAVATTTGNLGHSLGKMLAPIVDDAHLLDVDSLRRLRLLFEDFPKNHNLELISQPGLLTKLALTVNEDIKSRVAYSALVPKLTAEDMNTFILAELGRFALAQPHVYPRSARPHRLLLRGFLRRARNLCLSTLLEAVRDRTKNRRFETLRGAFVLSTTS